jgi:spermidine dehydrogenase
VIEHSIRDQLGRMLGPSFDQGDIAGLTVNRWSHGYTYDPAGLTDKGVTEAEMKTSRQPVGRVAIANADAGWSAYAHTAIDEAWRAVAELG